jgi:hypothetical protein
MPKSLSARIYIALIIVSGFLLLGDAVLNAPSLPTPRFIALLAMAVLAARLRIKLPGVTGVMSVNLPFILLAAALTGTAEALTVGFVSTFAQCLPREKQKLNVMQITFNCCAITLAIGAARWIFASPEIASVVATPALRLAVAAAGYFLANTLAVALVISLTESANLVSTWTEMFQLSFPYLVASAGVAGLTLMVGQESGWQAPLVLLPIMLGVFYSYRRYFAATTSEAAASVRVEAGSAAAGARI